MQDIAPCSYSLLQCRNTHLIRYTMLRRARMLTEALSTDRTEPETSSRSAVAARLDPVYTAHTL